ncbi:MAG: M20/M25/M40 family metallo-hydrolase [Planctomycetota bacterium]
MHEHQLSLRPFLLSATVLAVVLLPGCVHRSPGTLHKPSDAPLTDAEEELRQELVRDVQTLATEIGPRNSAYTPMQIYEAERWLLDEIAAAGLEAHRVEVKMGEAVVANIEVTFPGDQNADEVLVIGAHYDTAYGSPGANDNASGVAMLLAAVRRLGDAELDRTVRIVFFVNEEYPFTTGIQMGSKVYAKHCLAQEDRIVAMINVDSVGYFSNERGSQRYPILALNLPKRANFIAFGSNMNNAPLLDAVVSVFQAQSKFPSIGAASDSKHASRGDHAAFWWSGFPAIAMSDTSEYRDPHYHSPTDRAENLNYDEMARLANAFIPTVVALADAGTELPVIVSETGD